MPGITCTLRAQVLTLLFFGHNYPGLSLSKCRMNCFWPPITSAVQIFVNTHWDLCDSSSPKTSGRHECGGSWLFIRPLDRQHVRISQQPQLCWCKWPKHLWTHTLAVWPHGNHKGIVLSVCFSSMLEKFLLRQTDYPLIFFLFDTGRITQ